MTSEQFIQNAVGRVYPFIHDLGGKAEYLGWVEREAVQGTRVLRAMTALMRKRLDADAQPKRPGVMMSRSGSTRQVPDAQP